VLAPEHLRRTEVACASMIHLMPSANDHSRRFRIDDLTVEFEVVGSELVGTIHRMRRQQRLGDEARDLAWHRAAEEFLIMNEMEPLPHPSAGMNG